MSFSLSASSQMCLMLAKSLILCARSIEICCASVCKVYTTSANIIIIIIVSCCDVINATNLQAFDDGNVWTDVLVSCHEPEFLQEMKVLRALAALLEHWTLAERRSLQVRQAGIVLVSVKTALTIRNQWTMDKSMIHIQRKILYRHVCEMNLDGLDAITPYKSIEVSTSLNGFQQPFQSAKSIVSRDQMLVFHPYPEDIH